MFINFFTLWCPKPQKGTFTTEIGTPIFQQYNIFEVEKQAYVVLVALL